MPELPLVSVVTPSYNMGRFVEETIRSVLSQDYPRIEYIVMDGGSSDGTLEILEKYKDRLQFHSQPDQGAADAIHRGFGFSKGEILAWLSADDTYLPGAVSAAVEALARNPEAGVVYGDAWWVDESGKVIDRYPTRPFDPNLLQEVCFLCQPATFIRREAYEKTGGLNLDLVTCFDYELWMRISRLFPIVKIDRPLATSRMHAGNMTMSRRRVVFSEACQILSKHCGYVPFQWIYDYAIYLVQKQDVYPAPFSVRAYLLSLILGLRFDLRRLPRFLREWLSAVVVSPGGRV
jgi:glycosyltransferase involved in cell wall biosynthesis